MVLNHLLDGEEQEQKILHQDEGILYQKLQLWILSGLRLEVCESEHDSKVASHRGNDETTEHIRINV
jgi:hypothetical protein